jgi:hypothetical protein
MIACLLVFLAASAVDSNRLSNPGFESGTAGWSLWARSGDSARFQTAAPGRTGGFALEVDHDAARDWTVFPTGQKVAVKAGELWEFSGAFLRDSLHGNVSLSFVLYDTANAVVDWSASASPLQASGSWQKVSARLLVARGIGWIQPRITGDGPVRLRADDFSFHLTAVPSRLDTIRLVGDSLSCLFDPLDASIRLDDPQTRLSWTMAGLPWMRVDSVRAQGDSATAWIRAIQDGWSGLLRLKIQGGSLRLRLETDSSSPVSAPFAFPGAIDTREGMEIAVPRGTGLRIPATLEYPSRWALRWAGFSEWQVSQALTGATDGKIGYVVSLEEGSVARYELGKGANGRIRPTIVQEPAKHRFGPPRTAVVAPLRTGGFAEMGIRRRKHLASLGHWATWTEKVRANPATARLEGAIDFWVQANGFRWPFFDSLSRMGMDRALVHWGWAVNAEVDSLQARGFLVSRYDNWADAFPGDTTHNGRELSNGVVIQEDGSPMKAWLEIHDDGTTRQALEICAARHAHLARSNTPPFGTRLARFVDVELAIHQPECWSPEHPMDRSQDLRARLGALGYLHDTLRVVTGSEQARDVATAVVDYGEGPMSIASTSNAGYDWSTPVAPEDLMDSMSMDPALRVPLMPLSIQQGFSPTWYTGDGQSKVPARWDDKDLWNALYATMPLVMPVDRKMWDTLSLRYLRTINAVGAILRRCQFQEMTQWENLSSDSRVQRTTFGNGWTVLVNFDASPRMDGGVSLPGKGYLAGDGTESVERRVIDGSVRTRVRLRDRWYLDPEGRRARIEGITTDRPVLLRRLDDSTILLTLPSPPDTLRLRPDSLPWPASVLRVTRIDGSAVPSSMDGADLVIVPRGQKFLRLRGDFAGLRSGNAPRRILLPPRLSFRHGAWTLRWHQETAAKVRLQVVDAAGAVQQRRDLEATKGWNETILPRSATPTWMRLEGERSLVMPIPPR